MSSRYSGKTSLPSYPDFVKDTLDVFITDKLDENPALELDLSTFLKRADEAVEEQIQQLQLLMAEAKQRGMPNNKKQHYGQDGKAVLAPNNHPLGCSCKECFCDIHNFSLRRPTKPFIPPGETEKRHTWMYPECPFCKTKSPPKKEKAESPETVKPDDYDEYAMPC